MHSRFKFPPQLSHIELLTVGTLDFVYMMCVWSDISVSLFGLDTSFGSVKVGLRAQLGCRVVLTSARSVQIYPSRRVRRLIRKFVGPLCVYVPWLAFSSMSRNSRSADEANRVSIAFETPIKCFSSFAPNCGVLQCVSALLYLKLFEHFTQTSVQRS